MLATQGAVQSARRTVQRINANRGSQTAGRTARNQHVCGAAATRAGTRKKRRP
jgi:hypothetical protein